MTAMGAVTRRHLPGRLRPGLGTDIYVSPLINIECVARTGRSAFPGLAGTPNLGKRLTTRLPSAVLRPLGRQRWLVQQTNLKRVNCTGRFRSEEHTSELQSRFDLVCRL